MISINNYDNSNLDFNNVYKTLNSIKISPKLFISEYFRNLTNTIDFHVETILNENPLKQDELDTLNKNRQLIIERVLSYEKNCIDRLDRAKFQIDLLPKINEILIFTKADPKQTLSEITKIKNFLFDNNWIFFKANKFSRKNPTDFGRLIRIDHILCEDLAQDFE